MKHLLIICAVFLSFGSFSQTVDAQSLNPVYMSTVNVEAAGGMPVLFVTPNSDGILISTASVSGSVGIDDYLIEEKITVYPNPTTDFIRFGEYYDEVLIFDSVGKIVLSNLNVNQVDVSSLPKGTYIAKFRSGQEYSNSQFVKL